MERVEQPDKPLALRICQDITLCENVSNLIKLEEELLAHDLERAYFSRILLLCEEDLTVAALTDLGQNGEVSCT